MLMRMVRQSSLRPGEGKVKAARIVALLMLVVEPGTGDYFFQRRNCERLFGASAT